MNFNDSAWNPSHEDWPLDAFQSNSLLAADTNLDTMHGGLCQKAERDRSEAAKEKGARGACGKGGKSSGSTEA